jgi:hypothetical protein
MRPPASLQDFFSRHVGDFAIYEVELADSLGQVLVDHGADKDQGVLLSTDEDNPIANMSEGLVKARMSGRVLQPPGVEWQESLEKWFKDNELDAVFDEDGSDSVIKFTVEVPVMKFEPSLLAGKEEKVNIGTEPAETKENTKEKVEEATPKAEPEPEEEGVSEEDISKALGL